MTSQRNVLQALPGSFLRQHARRVRLRDATLSLALMGAALCIFYLVYSRNWKSSIGQIFVPSTHEDVDIWSRRATQVKQAFLHAYHGYEKHAFPHDELRPVSNRDVDNFNGWGVTAIDSMSTMLVMGLDEEFNRALPLISNTNFSQPSDTHVPFFETIIRYLGGLLSAYALSGNEVLRDKADELGTKLAPAFNTSSGFPMYAVNTYQGKSVRSWTGILAEIASCQMEYAYLGKITGKKEHVDHATMITNIFYNANLTLTGGMYPTHWGLSDGKPSGVALSVGAAADSGHEYTLKQYLLTSRMDKKNLEMYLRFTAHAITTLLYLSPHRKLLYVTDATRKSPTHSFEHLSCFFPGLLALGAHLLPLNDLETLGINMTQLADDLLPAHRQGYANIAEFNLSDLHLWAAQGIAQTCFLTYADQPSGLGPESVRFNTNQKRGGIRWMDALLEWKKTGKQGLPPGVEDKESWITLSNPKWSIRGRRPRPVPTHQDYTLKQSSYFLRPETVESLYILWRVTDDVTWRQRGWEIFEAIERWTKTLSGYASVDRVHEKKPILIDSMPSYFLAETLKYLYLLFSDQHILPLDQWVFNTEAHPLPVFEWSQREKETYGIA